MSEADPQRPVLRLVGDDERTPAPTVDDPVEDVEDLPDEAVDALVTAYMMEHGLPEDTQPDLF